MWWIRLFHVLAYLCVPFLMQSSAFAVQATARCLSAAQAESLFAMIIDPDVQKLAMYAVDTPFGSRFISPNRYVASLLKLEQAPQVIFDANELRFLPFALPDSHIVLMTEKVRLSEEQIRKVKAVASQFYIKLSLVTLETPQKAIISLIEQSGGVLYDSQSILKRVCPKAHLIEP